MDHNLTLTEKPGNFAQYRWEVTCSCGWQGRGPTEAVAASMGITHGGTLPKVKETPKPVEPAKPATPPPAGVAPVSAPLLAPKTDVPKTTPPPLIPQSKAEDKP